MFGPELYLISFVMVGVYVFVYEAGVRFSAFISLNIELLLFFSYFSEVMTKCVQMASDNFLF